MINDKLIEYIKNNLKRGYTPESIQKVMIKNGYSKEDAIKAINYAQNKQKRKIYSKKNNALIRWAYVIIPIVLLILVFIIFLPKSSNLRNNVKDCGAYSDIGAEAYHCIGENILLNGCKKSIMINDENKSKNIRYTIIGGNNDNCRLKIEFSETGNFSKDSIGANCTLNINKLNVSNQLEDNEIKMFIQFLPFILVNPNEAGSCTGELVENLTANYSNSNTCSENWECEDWNECTEQGVQTRTCTDLNDCGTTNNKPEETEECTPDTCGGCEEWEYCSEFGTCENMECEDYNGAAECEQYQYCDGEIVEELTFSSWECCLGTCRYGTMEKTNECAENCINQGYSGGQCTTPQEEVCNSNDPNAIYYPEGSENSCCIYTQPDKDNITFPCCCENNSNNSNGSNLDLTCDDIEYLETEFQGNYYGQFRVHYSRNNLSFDPGDTNYSLYYTFYIDGENFEDFHTTFYEGNYSDYVIISNTNDETLEPGNYTLEAMIDSQENFNEIDEDNNYCEVNISVN